MTFSRHSGDGSTWLQLEVLLYLPTQVTDDLGKAHGGGGVPRGSKP